MVRRLAVIVLLAACGGSEKPSTPPLENRPVEAPPVEDAILHLDIETIEAGSQTMDELAAELREDQARRAAGPAPAVPGVRDAASIQKVVRASLQRIRYCYQIGLGQEPGLAGEITIAFEIAADGTVGDLHVGSIHPDTDECLGNVISSLRFPTADGGTRVSYPFRFTPET